MLESSKVAIAGLSRDGLIDAAAGERVLNRITLTLEDVCERRVGRPCPVGRAPIATSSTPSEAGQSTRDAR